MATFIEPKILKGFRDFLPAEEIPRRILAERIEAGFRSFGFAPIDTPALEYAEILLGKGGGETEKQIYRFKDNGNRDVALRFDLTVPFARFVAEHRAELSLPFKRYHIGKVWRGENTQRGRYREFTQCDFDIVGSDSAGADFEILLMMRRILKNAGAGDVAIKINHRGIFNRFLETLGIREKSADILRTVDKLGKIGRTETLRLLAEHAGNAAQAILDYIEASGTFEEILQTITQASGGDSPESGRLAQIRQFMLDTGTADSFVLDPSITRGLDYYTGIVYETFLADLPEIGSVCSGGRYDNLTGLYSKETLCGVGSSIGLDRLIAALETLGRLETAVSYSKVGVACTSGEAAGLCQALAERLRDSGIPCEALLEEAKLSKQCILAEKKGARWLVIPGNAPLADPITLRDLSKRENRTGLSIEETIRILLEN
ncbi:MAG: histidine--tRNA ligase [Spirochaetaceae bacterium]|jgi:histidyl-tRNA synthetase|nr:histidine--tRNA ligase [Spirochaetaceae bacterium]